MQKSIIYRTLINIFLAAAEKIRKNILIFSMFCLYYFAALWTIWSDLKQLNLVQARRRWFFGFYVLFERLVVQKSIIFYRNWPHYSFGSIWSIGGVSIVFYYKLTSTFGGRKTKQKMVFFYYFSTFFVFLFCVLCFVHSSKLWSSEQIWSRT